VHRGAAAEQSIGSHREIWCERPAFAADFPGSEPTSKVSQKAWAGIAIDRSERQLWVGGGPSEPGTKRMICTTGSFGDASV
jgi:hypothetical protein